MTVSASTISTTLTGLPSNKTSFVRIMAVGKGNYTDSDYSAIASAKTPKTDSAASAPIASVPAASASAVAFLETSAFDRASWDDNLFAFLADEQLRLQRQNGNFFGDDDTDNWLANFEKLALLELRK